MVAEQSSVHVRDEGEEEDITIPVREKDYEQEGHEQEEGEDGVDEEEEEEEDEECGDDDGYTLRFHGEMDPMKFAEEDASGAQPYEQFERLKCEALAERERKRKALDSCSNEAGKKARQEGFFGANIDEIMEAVDFSSRRRSRQPKKRGRKKGSKSKLSPEVMEKLGIANLHYAFGRFDEALNVLKEVVRLAPNLADSYHTLGLVYSAIGDKKKALNFYMIAAHLTPKDAFLWKRLVDWSMELGNMGQVIYCLSKAIAADPEDMGLKFKRASLYIERGDYQKASESFDQILRMHPADVEACKMCAKMYCTFGQKEKAVEILERYVQDHFAAADLNLFNFLATLLMEDKFYQRALEHIERARSVYCLKKLPLYLSVKAGICYAYLGEIEKSEMLFMDLQMENVGGCADLLWEAANAMMSVGRYESALKYLLLLNEMPEHSSGPLYLKIAQCYLHLKENEKAVHFSYKAVGVMEDSIDARLTLASLLCQENKEDEAISLLIPPDSLGPTSNEPSVTDSVAWWRSTDIRKKLAKIYLGKDMLAEFVDTIFPVIHETLLIEITNMKVRMRKKLPKSVLSERVKLLDVEQSDVIFRGFRPIASSTDMTKASRARKKLQQIAAEKEEKRAAALAAGQEWQSDDSDDEPQQQAVREPPLPNLLKDDEHYQLLVDLCKALASLHRYWEELEIINRSLKAGEHILPAERKEELRTLGAQVAYRTRDPTHGYDYARYMVQKHPYSMAAWNCYYKVVSRMESRFSKHSKFLLSMRGKYKDCVPPIMICGHQFSMNSQHQTAAREYLEAYKLQPDNPLINLCVGTALINLALGLRVQNKNQCVAQGLAFLYNYQHLSQNSQEALYNIARAFHHVGFVTLAAAYYEKVLATHEKDYPIPMLPSEEEGLEIGMKGYCSLHREAAYNLHLIYKSSGALDLARQVLKDYCRL
ncbi:uncharacterized protein LOC116257371 isoform X2 [Nymphaea colorata]|uniref:uncharacterized protein LOC116257371 isoform X2 n=1 Tax=Nymphaea colorata TaxID=210225 RepID=UPI00129DBADE|nr:uncharacterized protein LOC116257371 isoform X2 [Nymphaea colorata]XP_031489896.1 uncharacterized protein LOC116257371 isoform X2 [Nymphaea colorata]